MRLFETISLELCAAASTAAGMVGGAAAAAGMVGGAAALEPQLKASITFSCQDSCLFVKNCVFETLSREPLAPPSTVAATAATALDAKAVASAAAATASAAFAFAFA